MKQKLKDILLLVKHERKWQMIIGAGVLLSLIVLTIDSGPKSKRRTEGRSTAKKVQTGATSADETSDELLTYVQQQNNKISKKLEDLQTDNKVQREKIKEYEDRTAQIFQRLIERLREQETAVESIKTRGNRGPVNPNGGPGGAINATLQEETLIPFGDTSEAALVAPPKKPEAPRTAIISAGSSVRVKILAGVNAPTDGTPYPVVLKTISDAYGPDGVAIPLGEARIIAAAQGSLVDQRALFRLTKMSTRYPDGSIQELDIDGWLTGEDGIVGMEGVLIDPIGKVLAGELVAGTIQGAGQALQNTGSSTSSSGFGVAESISDGNTANRAVGGGLSNASNAWSRYVEERTRLLVPHVKVLSGREATAVFSQSILLPGLYEAIDEESTSLEYLD